MFTLCSVFGGCCSRSSFSPPPPPLLPSSRVLDRAKIHRFIIINMKMKKISFSLDRSPRLGFAQVGRDRSFVINKSALEMALNIQIYG